MSEPNWKNRTLWTGRDNLEVMRGMNSESVDLIYLDPPFNSNNNYAAPIGSKAAGAAFKDSWTWDDVDRVWLALTRDRSPKIHAAIEAALVSHSSGMAAYLSMMAQRLEDMKRILRPKGTIYLHCDPTASHYLKLIMDVIFGMKNCRNEIVWSYGGRGAKAVAKQFPRNNDVLLLYAEPGNTHNRLYEEVKTLLSESRYQTDQQGRPFKTAPRGDYTDESVARLDAEGRIHRTRTGNIRIKYFLETRGKHVVDKKLIGSVWNIPDMMHQPRAERTGYPTQKPLALLRRVIEASSNPGDVVFDPFCGCATACVAAEELGRKWVGIDISHKAAELVTLRLQQVIDSSAVDRYQFRLDDLVHRTDQPQRTDMGTLPHYTTHKDTLYGKSGGYCGGCGEHFLKRNLTLDHIVPRSKGGTDHPENLWLLCGACNSSKGTKSQSEFLRDRMSRHGAGVPWLEGA